MLLTANVVKAIEKLTKNPDAVFTIKMVANEVAKARGTSPNASSVNRYMSSMRNSGMLKYANPKSKARPITFQTTTRFRVTKNFDKKLKSCGTR